MEGVGEGEGKRGGAAPSLVQFRVGKGACGHPLRPFPPFPDGPLRPTTSPGEFPVLSGTPKNTRITRNLSDVRI